MYNLDDIFSEVLITEKQIANRVSELAEEINKIYEGKDVILISIIKGAIPFTADLMRKLTGSVRLDCIRISSYKNSTVGQGEPNFLDRIQVDLKDQNVSLVDDILDTGATLDRLTKQIVKQSAASIRSCVLLDKVGRRSVAYEADFSGFDIPNEFVVGYGLDYAENYRHIPCIGVLKPELYSS